MSGGSFNYFYSSGHERVQYVASDLENMAKRCEEAAQKPPEKHWQTGEMIDFAICTEVAKRLQGMSFTLRGLARMIESHKEITRAIEWWCSGDSGAEEIVIAYREMLEKELARVKGEAK